ncbi:MAG: PEP-CTERM sorting domain-containing protein [Fimbriimonadaceae bacterium]
MRNIAVISLIAVSALSMAVSIPYSTGFETTEVPAWGSPNPATNVDWNGLNNWRVSTAQKFAGVQSLQATTNGTTALPSTTIQPTSFLASQNQGQIQTNVKLYLDSTSQFGTTSVNNVHGLSSNITWNSGISSRAIRIGVQNNGNVVLWTNSTFTYQTIGTISSFQNQWLDLNLILDTTNQNVGYNFAILNSSNTQVFAGSGNILTTPVTDARIAFTSVVAVANGSGGPMNAFYDNFNISQAVPEPASMTILGLGAAALLRRRKK